MANLLSPIINLNKISVDHASTGAIDIDAFVQNLTDTVSGTYTLANVTDEYDYNAFLTFIINKSSVSHTLTPANFNDGGSITMPASSFCQLIWKFDGEETFDGSWHLAFNQNITVNA